MHNNQEVYRSIEISDSVKTSSLSVLDQIRLIFASFANDDVLELDKEEKMTVIKLRKIAALRSLFETAVTKMETMGKDSVMLKVSSSFLPYIEYVTNASTGYGQFFNINIYKKELPPTVPHFFHVQINKRK